MRRFLQILGGLLLVIVVAAGVGAGYLFYVGPRLDSSSKAYVDQNVPIILKEWSDEALWNRAAPELRKIATREQVKNLFGKVSGALGTFQNYDGSSGEANIALLLDRGKVVTARYVVKVGFEKGPATLNVGLIEHDGQWQVLNFQVNSPLLLR